VICQVFAEPSLDLFVRVFHQFEAPNFIKTSPNFSGLNVPALGIKWKPRTFRKKIIDSANFNQFVNQFYYFRFVPWGAGYYKE